MLFHYFLRNPCHPDQRINEQRRNAQQIGLPISLCFPAEDLVQLLLQAAQRHIEQQKDPGGEKVNKPDPEAGPVRVLVFHMITFVNQVADRRGLSMHIP